MFAFCNNKLIVNRRKSNTGIAPSQYWCDLETNDDLQFFFFSLQIWIRNNFKAKVTEDLMFLLIPLRLKKKKKKLQASQSTLSDVDTQQKKDNTIALQQNRIRNTDRNLNDKLPLLSLNETAKTLMSPSVFLVKFFLSNIMHSFCCD